VGELDDVAVRDGTVVEVAVSVMTLVEMSVAVAVGVKVEVGIGLGIRVGVLLGVKLGSEVEIAVLTGGIDGDATGDPILAGNRYHWQSSDVPVVRSSSALAFLTSIRFGSAPSNAQKSAAFSFSGFSSSIVSLPVTLGHEAGFPSAVTRRRVISPELRAKVRSVASTGQPSEKVMGSSLA